MSRLSQKCFQLAGKSINAYVTACYRKRLSEIIVPPICYKCCLYCPLSSRDRAQSTELIQCLGMYLCCGNIIKIGNTKTSHYWLIMAISFPLILFLPQLVKSPFPPSQRDLVTDKAEDGKMMERGIDGTDALDWDIFLRGHGRRQMSKSEEVAAKINCSCDSQNTTRPAETKSKDFPFCRYFRKKAL